MNVVADASVLISLSAIGELPLLPAMFPAGVLVPDAVWREGVEDGGNRPGARLVAEAKWVQVRRVGRTDLVKLLKANLDDGEAEAIALAQEIKADLVLLDERDARRAAEELGLSVLGSVGILLKAKKVGRIPSLRVVLDRLQTEGHFRMSLDLYVRAVREAGE